MEGHPKIYNDHNLYEYYEMQGKKLQCEQLLKINLLKCLRI